MPKVLTDGGDARGRRRRRRCRCSRGPGDGSIRTRRVAILVADGVDGDAAASAGRARCSPPARCRASSARGSAHGRVDQRRRARSRRAAGRRPVGAVRRAWCCRTAPTRSGALAADGQQRSSSSRTSTATASRSWCSAADAALLDSAGIPPQLPVRQSGPGASCSSGPGDRTPRSTPLSPRSPPPPLRARNRSTTRIGRAHEAHDRLSQLCRGARHTGGDDHGRTGTLHDAFLDELRDAYDAEKQVTKALPKMVKAASLRELRSAFETHLRRDPRGRSPASNRSSPAWTRRCAASTATAWPGIIEEGKSVMEEDFDDADDGCRADCLGAARRALRDGRLRHAGRLGARHGPRRSGRAASSRHSTRRRRPTRS